MRPLSIEDSEGEASEGRSLFICRRDRDRDRDKDRAEGPRNSPEKILGTSVLRLRAERASATGTAWTLQGSFGLQSV